AVRRRCDPEVRTRAGARLDRSSTPRAPAYLPRRRENPARRPPRMKAAIVGTGLIGGSLGLALRGQGWHVAGADRDPERAGRALGLGALDEVSEAPWREADITFVATPVGAVADEARRALAGGGVVTDVGGVKGAIV